MSEKEKSILRVWTIIVLIIMGNFWLHDISALRYSGTEVMLGVEGGMRLDITCSGPIRITAADGYYFRIVNGETQLYGTPTTPPLDYDDEDYFLLEGEMREGTWEIKEGFSVSIRLTSNEPFEVVRQKGAWLVALSLTWHLLLGAGLWIVGYLLMLVFDVVS